MSLGFGFRERECHFSLSSRLIRSSDFFEVKRKDVLREEGNAWTPVLRSFDKLREVGVLSYLFYTLFKCFVMFELIEAIRGHLIGSKSWNQSVEIFGIFLVSPDQFRD